LIALQHDVQSCRAERWRPALLRRLAGDDDPDIRLLCEMLAAWDDRYTLGGTAPVWFETFVELWQGRTAAERFPERLVPLARGHGDVAARLLEDDALAWFAGGTTAALRETT